MRRTAFRPAVGTRKPNTRRKILSGWANHIELTSSVNLANEAATIQFPLVKHAEGAGWQVASDIEASGKTFILITAARPILEDKGHFPGATVILVVDRNELEGQLSGWVARGCRSSHCPFAVTRSFAA